jgi:glycosyltransferase involved in cell wall biosynthesis
MALFIKRSSPHISDMSSSTKTNPPATSAKDSASILLKREPLNPLKRPPTVVKLKIINQFFPPDYAATGQLIEELAHNLKDSGYYVDVFTSQPSYAFDRNDSPRLETFTSQSAHTLDRHDSYRIGTFTSQLPQTFDRAELRHSKVATANFCPYPATFSTKPDGSLSIRRSQSERFWPQRIRGKAVAGAIFFLRTALHLLRHPDSRELVLLTTAPPFLPLLGYFLSRICTIRYVCLLYDLYPDIAIELGVIKRHHWISKLWDRLNRLTWREAAGIIVLSETMKQRILAKQPGIDDKIVVIPSWVDTKQIVPMRKQDNWFAQEHELVEPFTVLYSGNMGRCHDMDTLLNAIILLRDTPIKFVFIGSGDKRKDFQQRVGDLGLTNCLFLPYQSRENLPFSLTACDVSIVSISERMEGLVAPSKLYSALASGRPIVSICQENSYLNDVFAQARCGITLRNGDSQGLADYLHRLSQNPRLTEALGRSGHKYCLENYTAEKIAGDYQKLFQSLAPFQK